MNQKLIHSKSLMTNNWIKVVPDWSACDSEIAVALARAAVQRLGTLKSLCFFQTVDVGDNSSGRKMVAIKHYLLLVSVTALIIGGHRILTNW